MAHDHPAVPTDEAVWTRVGGVDGRPLDLLHARIPHRHYAPHLHAEYSVGASVTGVEVITYRGERHYAGPGSVVVLEPGEPHTGGPATPSGFAYRAMYPRPVLLSEGLTVSAGRPHFPVPILADQQLAAALNRVHDVLRRADPLEAETRLAAVLAELVRRHAAPVRLARDIRTTRPVAHTVMTRLADQLTAPPTLADIAADLGLSRYQLLRAFRAEIGMPPYAWLAQYRVTRARGLLEAGYRLADAATLAGFADQAHLTRWFRRVIGVTPAAYRNSVQDFARRDR